MAETGFQKTKPKEPAGYTTANINSDLHRQIREEAARKKQSFSAQVQEYRDHAIALEEQVSNLLISNKTKDNEIKVLKERSKN